MTIESIRVLQVALKNALLDDRTDPDQIITALIDTLDLEKKAAERMARKTSGALNELRAQSGYSMPEYLTSPVVSREQRLVPDESIPF